MNTPNGLPALIAEFGDIHAYLDPTGNLKPEWQTQFLAQADLPFTMPLAWNLNVSVSKITCHKLLVETFQNVFAEILTQGLRSSVSSYGGCFAFRPQRSSTKLSTHSWGIAIDLNPATNQQGTDGHMDPGVVKIFNDFGFTWGGIWSGSRRDPMHFQFCSGY
jgi:hypothetical protein